MFTGIVRAVGRTVARRPASDGVRISIAPGAPEFEAVGIGDSIAVNGCCLTVVAAARGVLEFEVSAETLACTAGFPAGAAVNLEPALRLSDRLDGHLVSGHVDGTGVVASFQPVAHGGAIGIERGAVVEAARDAAGEAARDAADEAARDGAGEAARDAADEVARDAADEEAMGAAGGIATRGSFVLAIDIPRSLGRYVAPKGSIAVDGVSLTTNSVSDLSGGRTRFTVNLIPHTLGATTLGSLRAAAVVNLEVDLLARYLDRLRDAERT